MQHSTDYYFYLLLYNDGSSYYYYYYTACRRRSISIIIFLLRPASSFYGLYDLFPTRRLLRRERLAEDRVERKVRYGSARA